MEITFDTSGFWFIVATVATTLAGFRGFRFLRSLFTR